MSSPRITRFGPGLKQIYFPNIIFKMVRAPNLLPNQAAFRIPPSCNKFDIYSYLTNIYDVKITDIRTMNYATRITRRAGKETFRESAYKKAIVTIVGTFNWPKPPNLDSWGMPEKSVYTKLSQRKLKGWRVRPLPKDKADLEILQEKLRLRAAKRATNKDAKEEVKE
ncbi:ribosomal protein L23-domain-containing protein [Endogone sp. FLAS-F59071]|nr:ribosomal protein L23-domain-containing protein [Endogone sp. FLAS-F59071]|eukprot:RUS22316.1 ribosomal protein L23-domain-containing protein [Endogone sp. FLAS-F59071]